MQKNNAYWLIGSALAFSYILAINVFSSSLKLYLGNETAVLIWQISMFIYGVIFIPIATKVFKKGVLESTLNIWQSFCWWLYLVYAAIAFFLSVLISLLVAANFFELHVSYGYATLFFVFSLLFAILFFAVSVIDFKKVKND